MGLDMHMFSTTSDLDSPTDFQETNHFKRSQDDEEIFYWRKHPNLHGWMEYLYRVRGGKSDEFNLVPVKLELEDLEELEIDVKLGNLPETIGFFFGTSEGRGKDQDLEFIAKARSEIAKGKSVYYTSSW